MIKFKYIKTLIQESIVDGGGIVVLGAGLGLDYILFSLLYHHCVYKTPDALQIVLDYEDSFKYYSKKLKDHDVSDLNLPNLISSKISLADRLIQYQHGGVFFISNRVLIADLLLGRLLPSKIEVIYVINCNKIKENSVPACILKFYRDHHTKGTLLGLCDSLSGLFESRSLQRICTLLKTNKIALGGRNRDIIEKELKEHPLNVVELKLHFIDSVAQLNTNLIQLIKNLIVEMNLNRNQSNNDNLIKINEINNSVDIHKFIIQFKNISFTKRQRSLYHDIEQLYLLLNLLFVYDSVNFYITLNTFFQDSILRNSIWLLDNRSNIIMFEAQKRIYTVNESDHSMISLHLEPESKFNVLGTVLYEIAKTWKSLNPDYILAQDNKKFNVLCNSLSPLSLQKALHSCIKGPIIVVYYTSKPLLTHHILSLLFGESNILKYNLINYIETILQGSPSMIKHNKDANLFRNKTVKTLIPKRMIDEISQNKSVISTILEENGFIYGLHAYNLNLFFILHYVEHNPFLIDELQPHFAVSLSPSVKFIRKLELYKNMNQGKSFRYYSILYRERDDLEYENLLEKEHHMFRHLNIDKDMVVVPIGNETNYVENMRELSTTNMSNDDMVVIVDSRELRSTLPGTLYTSGFKILPVSLEIGDYILTSTICIERKSLIDLIGSLNSGRLYEQMERMIRTYTTPCLLIETGDYSLNPSHYKDNKSEITLNDVQTKLVLLTKRFPQMRILWSNSDIQSMKIFYSLKLGHENPKITEAQSKRNDDNNNLVDDFLNKVPYISGHLNAIKGKISNISELSKLSSKTLKSILSPGEMLNFISFMEKKYTLEPA